MDKEMTPKLLLRKDGCRPFCTRDCARTWTFASSNRSYWRWKSFHRTVNIYGKIILTMWSVSFGRIKLQQPAFFNSSRSSTPITIFEHMPRRFLDLARPLFEGVEDIVKLTVLFSEAVNIRTSGH
ncbi:hypothetical protein BC936DRAFT_148211 [Jimgerdemannia flammicorona]|uniref:Uncharacterized protein n=1 Tax=Jimgerdemannia flammicorona TaxID=994334 RepID=A0A433D3K9_9FUNG|nr:hypothetical protein BC936DRAFT_148211 [Jimgerdemannia flammicorona]